MNPLEQFGISDDDITFAIGQDLNTAVDEYMENTVVSTWQSNSPEDSGEYKDSIQVTRKAEGGKGQVGALDEKANIIEYGSEDTPEFAPRARTESQLGGRT